jgi:hypothetical protein
MATESLAPQNAPTEKVLPLPLQGGVNISRHFSHSTCK